MINQHINQLNRLLFSMIPTLLLASIEVSSKGISVFADPEASTCRRLWGVAVPIPT